MPVSLQHSQTLRRTTSVGLGLLLLVALALSISASLTPRYTGDLPVALWVQSLATPWLDTAMEAVTFLGDDVVAVSSILILAAGLFLARRWQLGVAFLGVLILEGLLQVFKLVVDRPRPSEELVRVIESGSSGSFPSGHAYHAVLFWGLVQVLLVVHIRPLWLRRSVAALTVAFILLSGVSRVYVGAHWPSDVLGSVALGIPSVALLYYLCQRLKGVRSAPEGPGQ